VRATNGRWRIGVAPAGGASLSVAWPRSFGQSRESAGAAATTKAAQSG
jgi:hypothetical protein